MYPAQPSPSPSPPTLPLPLTLTPHPHPDQVWDYGDMSGNCLFGQVTMPASQLLQSHVEEADPDHAHLGAGQVTLRHAPNAVTP